MAHHRFFSDASAVSRREMLLHCGTGFGALALADLMSQAGLLSAVPQGVFTGSSALRRGSGESDVAEIAAAGRQSEACDPYFLQRRGLAGRYVRSEAGAGEIRRQIAADGESEDRTKNRRGASLALQVPKVRRKRHRSQRDFPKRAQAHRRHVRHPLDARRRAESRAVAAADELRRRAG